MSPARRQDFPFSSPAGGPRPWRLLGGFLVLALGIGMLGWWAYRTEADHVRQREYAQLQAISHFKAAQIRDWLAERRWNTMLLFSSSHARQDFELWLTRRDPVSGERLKGRLESLMGNNNYVGAELIDPEGKSVLLIGSGRYDPGETSPAALAAAGRATEPVLWDLHRHETASPIRLAFLMPIHDPGEGKRLLGFVWVTVDPERVLYPLIQSWPTPSVTAETAIVRREGDRVQFLNKLRHIDNTSLQYSLPLARGDLPAAQAVLGHEGIFEGQDYRGVKVLSYLQPIPGTPWRMITKVDRAEVFQDIQRTARDTLLAITVLLLFAGTLLWMYWRRQQLLAMLELRHEVEHVADLSPGAIHSFRLRPDGSVSFPYSSPSVRNIFGYGPEELARDANPIMARIHPDDAQRLRDAVMESARQLTPWQAEYRYQHPEKGEVWLEEKSAPARQPDGTIIWHGFLSDVTERKLAEQGLAASETRYRSLFEHMLEGFVLCRVRYVGDTAVDFLLLEVNPAFEQLTGLKDVVGKWITEVIPDIRASNPELLAACGRVGRTGQVERLDIYMRPLDRWFAIALYSPVPEHVVNVFDDITDRKQAQLALEAYNNQLEAQVAARTAALVDANRELQAFTYAASHDLKAPLRGINGFANLLERNYRDRLEDDGARYLDHICRSAARMTNLIDDLLAYAHLEQQTRELRDVDLAEAVHSVVAERSEEIHQRGVLVRVEMPPAKVQADPHGLAQVLRNLVDNALKYSAKVASPEVEIGGENRGGTYLMWVRDNGVGFDMSYHDRIFEIFRRLHTEQDFPGTGVGLALVRKAVDRMGGRVWAESAPGQGATFYLELRSAVPAPAG
ncbi:MAG TPA: ATP-binding protein [Rhodocyclaceae bacterium]|nr:ATP-binding protein [Rhodocyclaceae bacterium]